jgi:hypothetical protein
MLSRFLKPSQTPTPTPKSVEDIVSVFTKTIEDLEQASRDHLDHMQAAENARYEAETRRDKHQREAGRAAVVAEQIRSLVVPV